MNFFGKFLCIGIMASCSRSPAAKDCWPKGFEKNYARNMKKLSVLAESMENLLGSDFPEKVDLSKIAIDLNRTLIFVQCVRGLGVGARSFYLEKLEQIRSDINVLEGTKNKSEALGFLSKKIEDASFFTANDSDVKKGGISRFMSKIYTGWQRAKIAWSSEKAAPALRRKWRLVAALNQNVRMLDLDAEMGKGEAAERRKLNVALFKKVSALPVPDIKKIKTKIAEQDFDKKLYKELCEKGL